MTFKEQIEWKTIEDDLHYLEEKVEKIEEEMAENGNDYEKLASLENERQCAQQQFDQKMERWDYLSQYAD